MDIWVNFTNTTKLQAEAIFKHFFPSTPPALSPNFVPALEEREASQLAQRFADAIPEEEISV
jgi:chaperone BCS1